MVTTLDEVEFSTLGKISTVAMGNLELIELRQNLGDYSVSFLPERRTWEIEQVSMWRLAPTKSRYDGQNQSQS